jgi:hypothetical protein
VGGVGDEDLLNAAGRSFYLYSLCQGPNTDF